MNKIDLTLNMCGILSQMKKKKVELQCNFCVNFKANASK